MRLRELEKAATSGPWELLTASDWSDDGVRGAMDVYGVASRPITPDYAASLGITLAGSNVCGPYMDFATSETTNFANNAALIVAMRNALPLVLELISALKAADGDTWQARAAAALEALEAFDTEAVPA